MASLKQKGDLAELMVAADLLRKGHKVAIPYGEDWDYDLIVDRAGSLERVQVKYAESKGVVLTVRCRSHSLTSGKVRRTKRYTGETIDWIAVYDPDTNRCYYIAAAELGEGRETIHLRVTPARNGQRARIHTAAKYLDLEARGPRRGRDL